MRWHTPNLMLSFGKLILMLSFDAQRGTYGCEPRFAPLPTHRRVVNETAHSRRERRRPQRVVYSANHHAGQLVETGPPRSWVVNETAHSQFDALIWWNNARRGKHEEEHKENAIDQPCSICSIYLFIFNICTLYISILHIPYISTLHKPYTTY
jgi:hypothetical protein